MNRIQTFYNNQINRMLLVLVFGLSLAFTVQATAYRTVSAGLWTTCTNWMPSCPPLTLLSLDSVIIDHDIVYDQKSLLTVGGSLYINGSLTDNGGGGSITNNGQINISASGKMIAKGIRNNASGIIFNYGQLDQLTQLQNDGTIFSDGILNLKDTGTSLINNNYIGSCGTVTAMGTIENNGIIENCVAGVYIVAGNFNNNGSGVLANMGTVTVGSNYVSSGYTGGSGHVNVCNNLINTPSAGWDPSETACVGNSISDATGNVTINCPPDFNSTCNINLPVEYSFIQVRNVGSANLLDWVTSFEENNDHFEIERSQDGSSFELIGSVDAVGNAGGSYAFTDNTPFAGGNFYRIKQVDLDGAYSFSKVVQVVVSSTSDDIVVFPNPSNGDQVNLSLASEAGAVEVFVYDAKGTVVFNGNWENTNPGAVLPLEFNQDLTPGFYLLQVRADQDWTGRKLIIK